MRQTPYVHGGICHEEVASDVNPRDAPQLGRIRDGSTRVDVSDDVPQGSRDQVDRAGTPSPGVKDSCRVPFDEQPPRGVPRPRPHLEMAAADAPDLPVALRTDWDPSFASGPAVEAERKAELVDSQACLDFRRNVPTVRRNVPTVSRRMKRFRGGRGRRFHQSVPSASRALRRKSSSKSLSPNRMRRRPTRRHGRRSRATSL
jgi:hypothetical protein